MPPPSSSSSPRTHRSPGRPREFDIDSALDGAIRIFRERGYHATSLGDLGAAMNLSAGSIYKAFADKRAVFLAALDRYTTNRTAELHERIDAHASGKEKLRAALVFHAESAHGVEGKRGCLIVAAATDLATFDSELAARISDALQGTERLFRELIKLAQKDGSIAATVDADNAARLLLSVTQGFSVIGKTGRTRAQMLAAAECAIALLA